MDDGTFGHDRSVMGMRRPPGCESLAVGDVLHDFMGRQYQVEEVLEDGLRIKHHEFGQSDWDWHELMTLGGLPVTTDLAITPSIKTDTHGGTRQFDERLRPVVAEVLRAHPELPRPGSDYPPWVTGCLGELTADVWFVAENPSAGTAAHARADASVEDQWAVSPGDQQFRKMLVKHGFKGGSSDAPGGWRCYITDVIKSAYVVNRWNARTTADRKRVARWWAPVLRRELELGRPRALVTVGARAKQLLAHLEREGLLPALPPPSARFEIKHYVYVMSRPERGVPGGHPDRLSVWNRCFADVAQRLPSLPR